MVGGTNSKFIHICLSETSNFLESPDGAQQKGMGPKTKSMKKETIFLKNDGSVGVIFWTNNLFDSS